MEDAIQRVQETVGSDKVLLGLSGGVDSSVVAALLHRAIGDQLTCVFVDNGLLRLGEGDQVMEHVRAPHGNQSDPTLTAEELFLYKQASGRDRPGGKNARSLGARFIDVFDARIGEASEGEMARTRAPFTRMSSSPLGLKTGKAHRLLSPIIT